MQNPLLFVTEPRTLDNIYSIGIYAIMLKDIKQGPFIAGASIKVK
jgi:hypothetical protein